MRLKNILLTFLFALPVMVWAQVTTGTLTGVAKTEDGATLLGATITAVHQPTGSKYTTVAKKDGVYTLPNLRIGGPYTVTVHFTGFADAIFNDVNIGLGTPVAINAVLGATSQSLNAVTVVGKGKGSLISSQRTGTSTYISPRLVQSLPTINGSIQDFARLTPQVKAGNDGATGNSTGLSFAGQSNRYNQFSIDGVNASDAFGLGSTGTNGGQANLNPISIEAIQEIQIVLSPYDVTQGGFTGGGINAITKSGTNAFHGSLYGRYQNQGFIGKSVSYNETTTRQAYPTFKNETYGANLGGALIQNKLFFFVNYEHFEKSTPLAFDPTVDGSGSNVNKDTLENIKKFMQNTYGYDLGSYGAITNQNQSNSYFARLDWNISDKHKLTLRNNYVEGSNDIRSRSASTALFQNTGYKFTDKNNASVLELNSTFSSTASNVLRATYTVINDARISNAIPNVAIYNYDAVLKSTVLYNLGSDYSSAANSLDQKIFTITDNFTLYKGRHTMTFGTNNEFFNGSNVFLQGYYGAYTYGVSGTTASNNLSNFMTNTGLTQYQIGYSTAGRGDKAPANLKAAQLSVYAQDVWAVTKNFKLTYGLRVDLPVISSTPAENTAFNTAFAAYDVKTNQMPQSRLLYSPRVGFNWDVEGDGSIHIRGGAGLFTGRVPFVWISNQLSNTGVATKNLTYNATSTPTLASINTQYNFDKTDPQLGAFIPTAGTAAPSVINVIDKNFKFPQVFRMNLGVDKKLGAGFVATFEGVFTKNINNANYTNLNISDNGESTVAIGPTTRPLWTKYTNTSYAQVIKLGNTSTGYAVSLTAQIQKTFSQGWSGSFAYTYGTASSLNDIPSSVANSNWTGVQSVNGLNNLSLSTSNFDMGTRLSSYISKTFSYAKIFATTVTLIYTGQTGQRLSYTYNTELTGDTRSTSSATTSLAYLPANATEANFVDITGVTASQQWINYQSFIASNSYLQKHAGQNAERNGDKLPFENHFDLRVAQDFKFAKTKLQVFFDVLNVGNLLNSSWGRSYYSGGSDGFFPVTTALFSTVTSGAQKKDGVAVTTPTAATPAFTFNIANTASFTKVDGSYRPYAVSTFTSRYTSQIGIKYIF